MKDFVDEKSLGHRKNQIFYLFIYNPLENFVNYEKSRSFRFKWTETSV